MERLLEALRVGEAAWLRDIGHVFEPELSEPMQVQIRIDASLVAVTLKSNHTSIRSRFYGLMGDQALNFAAAAGCERLGRAFPDGNWRVKLAVSGEAPHAKLYMERPMDSTEIVEAASCLLVEKDVVLGASQLLMEVAETDYIERISAAPGHPIRMELYTSRGPAPGGGSRFHDQLKVPTGLEDCPSLHELARVHGDLCQFGRQRYMIAVDGRGRRDGLKVEYSDVPIEVLGPIINVLTEAPMMAQRRLTISQRTLAMEVLDHLSVRLRVGRPPHLTAYFNRSFAAVA